jgi:hypothetical protein
MAKNGFRKSDFRILEVGISNLENAENAFSKMSHPIQVSSILDNLG